MSQFAFNLEDRPGSIKEVGDMIRKHGGRMVSILTSYDMCDEGCRHVYIRISTDWSFLADLLDSEVKEALEHTPDEFRDVLILAAVEGFAYKEMIFAAPYISLMDLDNAVAQLERALARDARVIVMRPPPVRLPGISRSLADPTYDRFWARVNESGITVAMHGGDSGYGRYFADWGEGGDIESSKMSTWKSVVGGTRAPFDAMAALVCHGLFQRFPRIRRPR